VPAKRSWHDYNGSLVERGRVLIDVGFLKSTNIETEKMNEGKRLEHHFGIQPAISSFWQFLKIGFEIHIVLLSGYYKAYQIISKLKKSISHMSEEGCYYYYVLW
jgi:hypothetical protein